MSMDTADNMEEYMLKWNSHHSEICNEFLDCCRNEEFTDVTLTAGDQSFEVHKLVLSACSPYFRQLLHQSSCKHPVVYLNDVPGDHVAILLRYMYVGQIAVRRDDLNGILRTAEQLRIKGLSSQNPNSEIKVASATVVSEKYDESNERQIIPVTTGAGDVTTHPAQVTHAPPPPPPTAQQPPETLLQQASRPAGKQGGREGRKGYLPKKLRMSGDSESSARSNLTSAASPIYPQDSESPIDNNNARKHGTSDAGSGEVGGIRTPETERKSGDEANGGGSLPDPDEDHHHHQQAGVIDGTEEDQPVDFSQATGQTATATSGAYKPRYSILSNYLKSGRHSGKPSRSSMRSSGLSLDNGVETRSNPEEASISKAAENLAASWLEQSLTAMQTEEMRKDKDTIPLRETLGIDIADRLRSHFLSNLPTQSYAWLSNGTPNGGSPVGGSGGAQRAGSSQSGSGSARRSPSGDSAGSPTPNTAAGGVGAGKPSVTCELCGKKLADPSSLYRHRKIHSGDKPHKCPFCTRRFIQRYNMKQHIKTHRAERMTEEEKARYLPKAKATSAAAATAVSGASLPPPPRNIAI